MALAVFSAVLSSKSFCAQAPAYIPQWGALGSDNGQFCWPLGVAVDASGNVYVADSGNHRIQKSTSDGTFILTWGTYGTGNGQFRDPIAVAERGDNVFVVDAWNNSI